MYNNENEVKSDEKEVKSNRRNSNTLYNNKTSINLRFEKNFNIKITENERNSSERNFYMIQINFLSI